MVAHHGFEDLFLILEVQIRRALGHAGGAGDVFHLGGAEAFFYEQGQRGVQDFAGTRVFFALPARGGGLCHGDIAEYWFINELDCIAKCRCSAINKLQFINRLD